MPYIVELYESYGVCGLFMTRQGPLYRDGEKAVFSIDW